MEPTKTRKEWLSLETSMEDELTEYWGCDGSCHVNQEHFPTEEKSAEMKVEKFFCPRAKPDPYVR